MTITSDINYRSPKDVLDTLNRLLPLQHPMEAGSPLTGSDVDIVSYTDTKDFITKTVSAVTRCIGLGFKREHIALIIYRGREHSKLTPYDKFGPYSLRAPTGQYDLLGNTIFTDGDLLLTITKCLTAHFVLAAPLPRLRGRGRERGMPRSASRSPRSTSKHSTMQPCEGSFWVQRERQ